MLMEKWLKLAKIDSPSDLMVKDNLEDFDIEALYTKENSKQIDIPYLPNTSFFHVGQEFDQPTKEQVQESLNNGVSLLYFKNRAPNLKELSFVDFSIIKSFFNQNSWQESILNTVSSEDTLFYLNDMDFIEHKNISNGISAKEIILKGANKTQELAFVLFQLYNQLKLNKVNLNKIHFTFYNDSEIFLDIAKVRAFRFLYKELLESFSQKVVSPYIHTRFNPIYTTYNEETINIMRQSSAICSAMISNSQSASLYDYQHRSSSHNIESQRLTRNIQWILKEEAHLSEVYDPSRGSFMLENLTYDLAEASWNTLQQLIDGNYPLEEEVKAIRNKRIAMYKENKKSLIGTNIYATQLKPDPQANDVFLDKELL